MWLMWRYDIVERGTFSNLFWFYQLVCGGRFPTEATASSDEFPHVINCTYEISMLPVITLEEICDFNSYSFSNSRGGFYFFFELLPFANELYCPECKYKLEKCIQIKISKANKFIFLKIIINYLIYGLFSKLQFLTKMSLHLLFTITQLFLFVISTIFWGKNQSKTN